MVHIEKLSNELLLRVLEHVKLDHPRSLFSTERVSKLFNALTADILYRNLILTLSPLRYSANNSLFQRLDQHESLASRVWWITIDHLMDQATNDPCFLPETETLSCDHERGLVQLDNLMSILPKLQKLETIRWNVYSVPPRSVLSSVYHSLPNCTMELPFVAQSEHMERCMQDVMDFPCVSVLALEYYSDLVFGIEGPSIHELVSRCQRLRSLSLDYRDVTSDSIAPPPPFKTPLDPNHLLEKLCFADNPDPVPALLSPDQEGSWKENLNWSNIKALELRDLSFICLAPKLTNLKSLDLELRDDTGLGEIAQVRQFILDCPPLERLGGVDLYWALDVGVFAHLGSTLQELDLAGKHENSVKMIRYLQTFCPSLRRLRLTIVLEEQWPPRTLTAISEDLPTVSDLHLNIKIPKHDWGRRYQNLRKSMCCHIRVADIWSYIWTRREAERKATTFGGRATQFKSLCLSGYFVTTPFVDDRKVPIRHSLAVSLANNKCACHALSPLDQQRIEYLELTICPSVRDEEQSLGIATITDLTAARDRRLLQEMEHEAAEEDELYYVERVVPKLSRKQEVAEDQKLRQCTIPEFFRPLNL